MTHDRFTDGLLKLAMELAKPIPTPLVPEGWAPEEWAVIRGAATAAILMFRDNLKATVSPLAALIHKPTPGAH